MKFVLSKFLSANFVCTVTGNAVEKVWLKKNNNCEKSLSNGHKLP